MQRFSTQRILHGVVCLRVNPANPSWCCVDSSCAYTNARNFLKMQIPNTVKNMQLDQSIYDWLTSSAQPSESFMVLCVLCVCLLKCTYSYVNFLNANP
jgi:hypothetical protein